MKRTYLLLLIGIAACMGFTACNKNKEKCWKFHYKDTFAETEIAYDECHWMTEDEANAHKKEIEDKLKVQVELSETGHHTAEDCALADADNQRKCYKYSYDMKIHGIPTKIEDYKWLTAEEAEVYKNKLQENQNVTAEYTVTDHATAEDCTLAGVNEHKDKQGCYKFTYKLDGSIKETIDYEWMTEKEAEIKKAMLEDNLGVEVAYTLEEQHTTAKDCITANTDEISKEKRCYKFLYNDSNDKQIEEYEWMTAAEADEKDTALEEELGVNVTHYIAILHLTEEDCINANNTEGTEEGNTAEEKCYKFTYTTTVNEKETQIDTYEWLTKEGAEQQRDLLEKELGGEVKYVVDKTHTTMLDCTKANLKL